ncbi:MAG TPA: hypothetical protein VMB05_09075 [Solirubrobacteraceae bacterium]|nr:hypothetical protein [Solirubrobacteraceae bacterium]
MAEILVVANRTVTGQKLLDAMLAHAAKGETTFRFVVPATKPSSGLIIYDDAVRQSAEARVELATSIFAQAGLKASGEVGDPDPFMATMDAVAHRRPQAIIVSTYPATHSGWQRRDLIDRIHNATGLPVEHVVTDVQHEGLPFHATLVVANKTSSGEELIERLQEKAAADSERHVFIAVVPLEDGSGAATRRAHARLAAMLERLHEVGLIATGMIGDPDPYTAVMNALELFTVVDDIVISTLPDERSGWMRSDLVGRVRSHTQVPVEHVVVPEGEAAQAAGALG